METSFERFPFNDAGVIWWWERRRILFNAALLAVGTFSVLCMLIVASPATPFWRPVIEHPMILIGSLGYAFMANICYTGGWLMELRLRRVDPSMARRVGQLSFQWGLLLSCALTPLPIWYGLFLRVFHIET